MNSQSCTNSAHNISLPVMRSMTGNTVDSSVQAVIHGGCLSFFFFSRFDHPGCVNSFYSWETLPVVEIQKSQKCGVVATHLGNFLSDSRLVVQQS